MYWTHGVQKGARERESEREMLLVFHLKFHTLYEYVFFHIIPVKKLFAQKHIIYWRAHGIQSPGLPVCIVATLKQWKCSQHFSQKRMTKKIIVYFSYEICMVARSPKNAAANKHFVDSEIISVDNNNKNDTNRNDAHRVEKWNWKWILCNWNLESICKHKICDAYYDYIFFSLSSEQPCALAKEFQSIIFEIFKRNIFHKFFFRQFAWMVWFRRKILAFQV